MVEESINMKHIVLLPEQMKHLEELGVDTSDATLIWEKDHPNSCCSHLAVNYLCKNDLDLFLTSYAYTLQDIIEKLPTMIAHEGIDNYYHLQITKLYKKGKYGFMYWHKSLHKLEKLVIFTNVNILEAAYNMLCWCIENKYIKV